MKHTKWNYRRRARRGRAAPVFFAAVLLLAAAIWLTGRAVSAVRASGSGQFPDLYAGEIPVQREPSGQTIYLTFDDGPSRNTEAILDVLKERNAKATFFVTAQYDDLEFVKSMYLRIVREGHAIGLHSYTHNTKEIYRNTGAFLADLDKLNNLIIETTGVRPLIYRFPGGSRTRNASKSVMRNLQNELERRGYPFYDWDVSTGDDTAVAYPAQTLAKRILDGVRGLDSAVVLCHDNATPKTTAAAVAIVIDTLAGEGRRFDALGADILPVHLN